MYTKEEIDIIVLSSFNEIPLNIKYSLFSDGNYEYKKNKLIKTLPCGVYNKVESNFSDRAYRQSVLDGLEKKGIKCVTSVSADYPETLKNIDVPPLLLYCKGDTSLLKSNCFSVVGSRRTPPDALAHCKKLAGELSSVFTVVTGLAEGADTSVLEGALAAGGKVISVLANGFGCVYPACNSSLLKRVENQGLAITEHLPHVKPQPRFFPVRNRIIAGLSRGTLVVCAPDKSGALITAEYAEEYNRDVFAFPYSLGVAVGAGCNFLIKKGAKLTENVLDIFAAYGLDFNTHEKIQLTELEYEVYEYLKNSDKAFIFEVAESLHKFPNEIIPAMMSLQIKGLAVGLGGNAYKALNR